MPCLGLPPFLPSGLQTLENRGFEAYLVGGCVRDMLLGKEPKDYDITTNALVKSGETITSSVSAQALADIEAIFEASEPVKWQIANASGANQRTKGAVIASGSVVVSSLTLNGPNRQNADYTAQLSGYGTYTVGA